VITGNIREQGQTIMFCWGDSSRSLWKNSNNIWS